MPLLTVADSWDGKGKAWKYIANEDEKVYTFMIEHAKSGRAKCRKCGEKISKGEIRIGEPMRWHTGDYGWISAWHHVSCIRVPITKNIKKKKKDDKNKDKDGKEEEGKDDDDNDEDDSSWKEERVKQLCSRIYGIDCLSKKEKDETLKEITSDTPTNVEEIDPNSEDFLKREGPAEKMMPPLALTKPLLEFQMEGLYWMVNNENSAIKGGILADEMGMGKTIQTISMILAKKSFSSTTNPVAPSIDTNTTTTSEKQIASSTTSSSSSSAIAAGAAMKDMTQCIPCDEPSCSTTTLVVVPTSALVQWKEEIESCVTPGSLKVLLFYSDRENVTDKDIEDADVVLTTYPIVEYEWRKIINRYLITCEYCGKKFQKKGLFAHQKYFCGPDAVKTARLKRREVTRAVAKEKAMRTLKIKEGSAKDVTKEDIQLTTSSFPTPSNCYKELMAKAGRPAMSMYDKAGEVPDDDDLPLKEISLSTNTNNNNRRITRSSSTKTKPKPIMKSVVRKRKRGSLVSNLEEVDESSGRLIKKTKRGSKDVKEKENQRPSVSKNNESNDSDDKGKKEDVEMVEETNEKEKHDDSTSLEEELEGRPSSTFIHGRHSCDGCHKFPIIGFRYHSLDLPNCDLCQDCYAKADGKVGSFVLDELDRDRPYQQIWMKKHKGRFNGVGNRLSSAKNKNASNNNDDEQENEVQEKKVNLRRGRSSSKKKNDETDDDDDDDDDTDVDEEEGDQPEPAGVVTGTSKATTRTRGSKTTAAAATKKRTVASSSAASSSRRKSLSRSAKNSKKVVYNVDNSDNDDDFELVEEEEEEEESQSDESDEPVIVHVVKQSNKKANKKSTTATKKSKGVSNKKKKAKEVVTVDISDDNDDNFEPVSQSESDGEDDDVLEYDEPIVVANKKQNKKTKATPKSKVSKKSTTTKKRKSKDKKEETDSKEAALEEEEEEEIDLSSSVLFRTKWLRLILDEAHKIKARTTNTAKCIYAIESEYKWALTGTPLQNRVGDLYSLVRFLKMDPHAYYFCRTKNCSCKRLQWDFGRDGKSCTQCGCPAPKHYSYFNKNILNPINRYGYTGQGRKGMLVLRNEILFPAQLRRTKKERASDLKLPALEIIVKENEMNEIERDFYESLYMTTKAKFDGFVKKGSMLHNYAHIFELLARLRQACDHPYLTLYSKKQTSSKNKDVKTALPVEKKDPKYYCGICLDEISDMGDMALSGCKHLFHKTCIMEYSTTAPGDKVTCPVCRIPLTVDFQVNDLSGVKPVSGPETMKMQKDVLPSKSILSKIDLDNYTSSTKVEALIKSLNEMKNEKKADGELPNKAIVFSQYTAMLDIVEWRLKKENFNITKLLGSMTVSQRAANLQAFRTDPNVNLILMSLKSGGEGLNLQVANYVFVLEPWWNPAVESQAIMRAHRIGQSRPVTAIRFCTTSSIESRMFQLQEKKQLVFDGCMDGSKEALNQLSEDDLRFLFTR